MEVEDNAGTNSSRSAEIKDLPFTKGTQIMESDALKMVIENIGFQRQQKFKLEDHHFVMKVETKTNQLPLIRDILNELENSLDTIIVKLKDYYPKNETNLLFITIMQGHMISPIRSAGIDLQKSDKVAITRHLMSMLSKFLNSNENLRLDQSFKVFFKVFCSDHVFDSTSRRKTHLITTLGAFEGNSLNSKISGGLYIDPIIEASFPQDCLLIASQLAFDNNDYLFNGNRDFLKLQPLWNNKYSISKKNTAVKFLKKKLGDIKRNLNLPKNGPYNLTILPKLTDYFNSQIHIIKGLDDSICNYESWPEEFDSSKKQIFLFLASSKHVVPITNFKLFIKDNKAFCFFCKATFQSDYKHICSMRSVHCSKCFYPLAKETTFFHDKSPHIFCNSNIVTEDKNISCTKCFISFKTDLCFKTHFKTCTRKGTMCLICKKMKHNLNHICHNLLYCRTCKKQKEKDQIHFCPLEKQKSTNNWPKLVFFDFLKDHLNNLIYCHIIEERLPQKFEHLSFKSFSHLSENHSSFEFQYDTDSKRPQPKLSKFKRTNITSILLQKLKTEKNITIENQFMTYLLDEKNKNATFLSLNTDNENMSAVMKILSHYGYSPKICKNGHKFISMEMVKQKILFLNITNYFNADYLTLSKQFEYKETIKWLPSKYENSIFDQDKPELHNFLNWTDSEEVTLSKKNYWNSLPSNWNLFQEIIGLGKQHVEIITFACLKFISETFIFQKNCLENLKRQNDLMIHPFSKTCITMPSYSYKLLLYLFLNNENIYSSSNENQIKKKQISRKELEFVTFYETKYPHFNFIHAFNNECGQKTFGNYSVDLYSPISKKVYNFMGCYYHCHVYPDCKDPNRATITKETATTKNSRRTYLDEQERENNFINFVMNNFKEDCHEIVLIYECDWNIFKKSEEYQAFRKEFSLLLKRPLFRLTPRIAQRGGLLEVYNLKFCKSQNPTSIFKIADINSLYPFIAMTCNFPIGKPIIIIGNNLNYITTINNVLHYNSQPLKDGLIFCNILAPSNEPFPFLQYRTQDQCNVMALCQACAQKKSKQCMHKYKTSKSFSSVWTLGEINKALTLGYDLVTIFEIHYFENAKNILQNYFKALLSLRLKNSFDRKTNASFFVNEVNASLNLESNLKIKESDLSNNPSNSYMYKLISNSAIGKFSQNIFKGKSEIVNSLVRLQELCKLYEILDITVINENAIFVEYNTVDHCFNNQTSIYIGAEIAAKARIFLYEKMQLLIRNKCTIYAIDTDAIFYSIPAQQSDPLAFSHFPGDFKLVISDNFDIKNYYCLGNRNYCIIFRNAQLELKYIIKCKGLTLYQNSPINSQTYESFLELNFANEIASIIVEQKRNKNEKPFSMPIKQTRLFTFSNTIFIKRNVFNNNNCIVTFPYGYK